MENKKIYIGIIDHWGSDDSSYDVLGLFLDEQTAWKNALRVEYLWNIQCTTSFRPVDEDTLKARQEAYTQLHLQLFNPDWIFNKSFQAEWVKSREQFLELYGNFGYTAKIMEQVPNGEGFIPLDAYEERQDAEIRLQHMKL